MKGSIWLKVFFVLPVILFADYLLMALLGCTTCLFGMDDEFYCGPFCIAGKIILALSVTFFGYLIFPDIKKLINSKKDGTSAEKQKNI